MYTHRFGRKLKLPSTMAIKHGILSMMLQDELKAQALAAEADEVLVAHGRSAAEARWGDVTNRSSVHRFGAVAACPRPGATGTIA